MSQTGFYHFPSCWFEAWPSCHWSKGRSNGVAGLSFSPWSNWPATGPKLQVNAHTTVIVHLEGDKCSPSLTSYFSPREGVRECDKFQLFRKLTRNSIWLEIPPPFLLPQNSTQYVHCTFPLPFFKRALYYLRKQGIQRDVVWPNSALVYEPKCGGGGCGVSANEYSCAHGAQISNSIFNLTVNL